MLLHVLSHSIFGLQHSWLESKTCSCSTYGCFLSKMQKSWWGIKAAGHSHKTQYLQCMHKKNMLMFKTLINDSNHAKLGECCCACRQLGLSSGGFRSDVLAAVGAQDVVFARQETPTNQRHAAPFAVEAIVVPLALLERDVFAPPKTWDGEKSQ